MRYPEFCWCDVAIGGAANRNNVVEIAKLKLSDAPDCYRTVYRYPDAFRQHFEQRKSVAGYAGPAYADYFPVDIDSGDLEEAFSEARRLLERLHLNYDVNLNHVRCYFSGNKGFHVMIPDALVDWQPSDKLPQIFKKMAEELLQGIKHDGAIYDVVRLFRFANTLNSKSGLYKIPLYPAEILHGGLSQILELAKKPRTIELDNEYETCPALVELFARAEQGLGKEKFVVKPPRPAKQKLCYLNMLEGVGKGWRDNCAIRLAVYFKKQGLSGDILLAMLQAWNEKNEPPLEGRVLGSKVEQALNQGNYDYGCNDGILKAFCDENCYLNRKNEVDKDKIYTIADAEAKYREYVRKLEQKKITLGIPKLDSAIRGVAPGEVCQIMARSSVGKTAFLLNIIRHLSVRKSTVLFFTLEQPLAQIYERSVQIAAQVEGKRVEEAYRRKSPEISDFFRAASLNYANMLTIEEDFLTYDEMRQYIKAAEKKADKEIDVICIDYLGRMKGGHGTPYEVTSELAKQFKHLAKETDKAVIYLHQVSRGEGRTGAEPLTIASGRDSGVTEEAADFIIGLWRPEINEAEAQTSPVEPLVAGVLKNRKGMCGQVLLEFNKKTLTVYQEGEVPPVEPDVVYDDKDLPF